LGDFGRYWGQNKAIVGDFNGSVVYFNVGFGLTFFGRSLSWFSNKKRKFLFSRKRAKKEKKG
jgi:hypothetical protein